MHSISFHDQDLSRVKIEADQFQKNYNLGHNKCLRRFLFTHTIQSLFDINSKINKNKQSQKCQMSLQDCPNIKFQDNSAELTKNFIQKFDKKLRQTNSDQIQAQMLLYFIIRHHLWHIIGIIALMIGEVVCKLVLAILLKHLFANVSIIQQENNRQICYLLAFLCGTLLFATNILRQNGNLEIAILIGRIRSEIILLIYLKISKLSQFVINQGQQTGKIINLLSSDFNIIEAEAQFFFQFIVSPIAIIGTLIIAIEGFGYRALVIAVLLFLFVVMQVFLGKLNSHFMKQANVYKDKRVKTSAEVIQIIKPIKMFGLQVHFYNLIQSLRKKEVKDYFKIAFGKSLQRAFGNTIGYFSTYIFFIWTQFSGEGQFLSYAKMFAIIQLMSAHRFTFNSMGNCLSFYFTLQIIMQRMCKILNIKDKKMIKIDKKQQNSSTSIFTPQNFSSQNQKYAEGSDQRSLRVGQILFQNFCAFWTNNQPIKPFFEVDLRINPGQLIGIIGKVGSGKSGFLQSIIQQIPYYTGRLTKKGTVVYVQQQPVLFTGSIRENIIFGQAFQEDKYKKVIEMSCLDSDLKIFEKRDLTLIGDKGSNLSGGQRARISLARSLYFDADIYLFDDPISAVDVKVANSIYQNVILRMKGQKTVVFVTHRTAYLNTCDAVIVIDNGKAVKINEFIKLKSKLQELEGPKNRKQSLDSHNQDEIQADQKNEKQDKIRNVVKSQQMVSISLKSYLKYFFNSKANYIFFPICILLFIGSEIANATYIRTLSKHGQVKSQDNNTQFQNISQFWVMLGILQLAFFVFNFLKYFTLKVVIFCSNEHIHDSAVRRLLRISCSYFDNNPSSGLVNKFSNDMSVIDNLTFFSYLGSIQGFIGSIVLLINVMAIDKFYLIPGLLNILFASIFFINYTHTLTTAKNLDLITKTPVFIAVKQLTQGLIQIKIFQRRMQLIEIFSKKVNDMLRTNICFWNINRGYIAVLFCSSILTIWASLFIGIALVTSYNEALYGACILFFMEINDNYYFFLRQASASSNAIVSSQRMLSILKIETQKQLVNEYDKQIISKTQDLNSLKEYTALKDFQEGNTQGYGKQNLNKVQNQITPRQLKQNQETENLYPQPIIQLQNFSLRYKPELPQSLNKLQLSIFHHEKIGVIGRTGAGKSSIIQGLFRIYQPQNSSVYLIQGLDALKMGLHTLRRKIAVIPQTPFIFEGSVRQNIDIFNTKTDQQIWECLQKTNLKSIIENLPSQLDTNIGNLLSVGQKQLICLARALLNKTKILIMDQSTSNMDPQTNNLIQRCIKTNFAETTIITIAHQLISIADYDKVAVVHKGQILEYGCPYELYKSKGQFTRMVNRSGSSARQIVRLAKQKYEYQLKKKKE